jgi:hypothetical protein
LILVRRVTHHGLHLRQGETACKPRARQLKNQCFSTELAGCGHSKLATERSQVS